MATDRRIRVLLVAQPVVAGVPQHVIELLRHVEAAGADIHVMCPRRSVLWAAAAGRPRVRRHAMPDARAPHPGDLVALAVLVRLLRRVDVAHAHSSKAGMLVRAAAVLTRRRHRVVFTPHGWSFWACQGWAARLARVLERLAARWCAIIVAVSAHERDSGLAAGIGGPDQYEVVPNGVDAARFGLGPSPVHGRMVMVGRLAPPKRQDVAIRALALVRRTLPDAHLEVVGDGPLRRQLEELAQAEGVSEAVAFVGERDDVPSRLRAAACVVMASDYEACSLAVLEAMAGSRPVVASRVGGMDELVEDGVTGRLVANEPEEMAAAMASILVGADGEAMGAAARRRAAERFRAEQMAAAVLAAYRQLASREPPNGP